jgi:hypothetical protein
MLLTMVPLSWSPAAFLQTPYPYRFSPIVGVKANLPVFESDFGNDALPPSATK